VIEPRDAPFELKVSDLSTIQNEKVVFISKSGVGSKLVSIFFAKRSKTLWLRVVIVVEPRDVAPLS